jgi:hypothetical protein
MSARWKSPLQNIQQILLAAAVLLAGAISKVYVGDKQGLLTRFQVNSDVCTRNN